MAAVASNQVELTPAPEIRRPSDAIVYLEGLEKTYQGGTTALADVNLAVKLGEFVSLLGPSGCGKSTVLRTVAGLQTATTGTVHVLGSDVKDLAAKSGDLAFVFQESTLMPWRTVLNNVALPLELLGVPKAERVSRAMDMIGMVGLADVADKLPRHLSGGMKMRVSIARALVSHPKLLLLDEPFAALDEMTRQRLQDELLRLWRLLGMTVIFVTHNVFEAVYLSSKIVVMQSNPGTIKTELSVDIPYPRDRDVLTTPEFSTTVSAAMRALGEG